MEPEQNSSLLRALCAAPGISGHEGPVVQVIRAYFQERGLATQLDRIGNLTAHLPGPGPRVLLLAHLDEVGYLVRKIDPAGFLRLERVGGASLQALPGQGVHAWTPAGPLPGVVSVTPPHLLTNAAPAAPADLFVDLGTHSKAETLQRGVEVGTPVTLFPAFQPLGARLAAKALDDRLGCYLLMLLADRLSALPAACDLTLAFVVQEENLLGGGAPLVARLEPDWALGVDATLAFDTPDLAEGETEVRLGGGPAVKIMDHLRGRGQGFIAHLGLRQHIEALADARQIPVQKEIVVGLSTALAPLPFAHTGLPAAAISFPLRYSHSPLEVADWNDVQATFELLLALTQHPWKSGT